MVVSLAHRSLVRSMRKHGVLPVGGAVLELGKGSWSAPVDSGELLDDVHRFVDDAKRRTELEERINNLAKKPASSIGFELVDIFYEIVMAPSEFQAIDFDGLAGALRHDLNHPVTLPRRFDIVINHGAAQRAFNIAQVFRTMHEYTAPGGLMIHESTFTGCLDSGFYKLQPTLFADIALSNQYEIRGMFIVDVATDRLIQVQGRDQMPVLTKTNQIPRNSMLFTVMRKASTGQPFQMPVQGVYSGQLSQHGRKAWRELR